MNAFRNLPTDIVINHIMPYLHKPQPPNLLSDIRSFYQDYNLVENYYAFEYNFDILLVDICIFFRRHYCYKDMDALKLTDVIINNFEVSRFENITRKTRSLWGLMRPIQRTRFINEYVLIDEHM